jgi:hypothetical protein
MHIHNQMNPVNAANFYGAAQNERAEANRQAAETRRKLALNASRTTSSDSPNDSLTDDETFLVGHWLGTHPHDSLAGDEYRGSSQSREDDLV